MSNETTERTLHERLVDVQSRLVAPKAQFNKFGNYPYRSCEDIVEAVKPLLQQNAMTLVLFDEVVQIGNRYYVKATAQVSDGNATISVVAYARESEVKKGMDESQITGAASSYARKYALNGLFCIDDTKDADTINTHENIDSRGISAQMSGLQNGDAKSPVEKLKEKMDVKPSEVLECGGCGRVISAKVHTFSIEKFKTPLCFECQKVNK
jgi:hypothetical protein